MMFLLRCAFCLSIVYAMILSSQGILPWGGDGGKAVNLVRGEATALVAKAARETTALCARHAEDCLADAARLTNLFHAAEPEKAAPDLVSVVEHDIPLPVPDPRRRLDAKLTPSH